MAAHIVFVRFFLDARDDFPFHRFAHLTDSEVGTALEVYRKEWLAMPETQRQQREHKKRIAQWNQGILARPGRNSSVPGRADDERKKTPHAAAPPIDENANRISPRYPLALFPTKENAEVACRSLQSRVIELKRAALEKMPFQGDAVFFAIANPWFSVIAEPELAPEEKIAVMEKIERLSRPMGKTMPREEAFLRKYLPELERILALCRATSGAALDRQELLALTILFHGEKAYSIGKSGTITVTDPEHAILQEFMGMPSMDTELLVTKVGNDRAPRILGQLTTKYKRVFAPAIRLPGGKGKGGYHVSIQDARQTPG